MIGPETEWKFTTDTEADGLRGEAMRWLLLEGNRLALTAGIVVVVVGVTSVLTALDIISVGSTSSARTLFASGVTSGLLTLITVALSINQLILSRVFGSPSSLEDRLDGTLDFRETVEDIANRPSSPRDPTDFLELVMSALHERTAALDLSEVDLDGSLAAYPSSLATYSENVADKVSAHDSTVGVLSEIVGDEYAQYLTATTHIRNEHEGEFSEETRSNLDDVLELLKALAIARQYFKTLSIQQNLARLSRLIAYTGVTAFVVTVCLTLIYQSSSGTYVPPAYLPVVVNLGIGVIAAPLAVLIAYVLRVATIARYTVTVGPFVPPEEQAGHL